MRKMGQKRKIQTTALVLGIMWALSGTAMATDAGITTGNVGGTVYTPGGGVTGEYVSGGSIAAVADSLNTTGVGLTTVGNSTGGVQVNGLLTATGGATVNNGATINGGATVNNGLTAIGTTNINSSLANGDTTIGNVSNSLSLAGSTVTINAATTNAITGGTGNTLTATTGANTINAAATNDIIGGAGNSITATTGNNTINATTGSNSISANAANQFNSITATGLNGVNNLTANSSTGTNNIEAKFNNIGVATGASINSLGNTNIATTVTANGGNAFVNVSNGGVTLGTNLNGNGTTGGYVATTGSTATIRASNSGAMASNGTSGNLDLGAGGGYTAYATNQTIGANTTIPTTGLPNGILVGKTYQNIINGNTFMDGNVYINGTLDYVSSNSANTSVIGSSTGTSNLTGATQATTAGTAIVVKGSTATHSSVDANGRITQTTGTADQSSASLTMTNGLGNTHGLVITESQATLSGGTHSSSLTMADNGATFSNAQTGAPIQVHGVDDGTADFDAVNVRQMAAGVAMAAGLAAMPQVEPGKTFGIAAGSGVYLGQASLSVGLSARVMDRIVVKGGVSFVPTYANAGATGNFGVGYSW